MADPSLGEYSPRQNNGAPSNIPESAGETIALVSRSRGGSESSDSVPRYWAPRVELGEAKVGQWKATAISGNDLLSSCLYCSALVVQDAGWLAPICLLIVSATLKLYQGVYWENGTALPFNGGSTPRPSTRSISPRRAS